MARGLAGYETGFVGKYLNGYSFGADPFPPDWDGASEVTLPCPTCRIPAGWDTWHGIQLGGGLAGRYAMAPFTAGGQKKSYVLIESTPTGPMARGSHAYQTDELKRLAVDFVDKRGVKPFFLYVAPLAVHTESFIRDGRKFPLPTTTRSAPSPVAASRRTACTPSTTTISQAPSPAGPRAWSCTT